MSYYEFTQIIIQVIIIIGIFLTLIVYYKQLKLMNKQIQDNREYFKGQNFISIINYLQDDRIREARRYVINKLYKKDYINWNEKDNKMASIVCSSYDTLAILVYINLIPKNIIIENYGPSIINCYNILKPFIIDMQKPENSGSQYWNDIIELYNEAKNIFNR